MVACFIYIADVDHNLWQSLHLMNAGGIIENVGGV